MNRVRYAIAAIGLVALFCWCKRASLGRRHDRHREWFAAGRFHRQERSLLHGRTDGNTVRVHPVRADGRYYFQVTDLSGATLLSSDPVTERLVTVRGGVLFSYNGHTHEVDLVESTPEEQSGESGDSEEAEDATVRNACGGAVGGPRSFPRRRQP